MIPPSALKLILLALPFLLGAPGAQAQNFGTAEEARAMLDRAVAAVGNNKEKACLMNPQRAVLPGPLLAS